MKLTRREAAGALTGALGLAATPAQAHPRKPHETHTIWATGDDAGTSGELVRTFAVHLQRANTHKVVVGGKQDAGSLLWSSRRFPQLVAPAYRNFDVLEPLARETHDRGIELHIRLIDFLEGTDGLAFRTHPEWAQLNAAGQPAASQNAVWMCPARRPGYPD